MKYNFDSITAVYLIECQLCGEQCTGSAKTKFRSRAIKGLKKQQKIVNKEIAPEQSLKQKGFDGHCCSDRHNRTEDWVITLINSADTLNELRRKELC